MTGNTPYRVAIIGCGFIAATAHVPGFRALGPRVEIVACADVREEAAAHLATQFGIPRYYTDPHRMLKECEPDLVAVCTANNTHKEWTIAALQAGAHVLCEKPLALSLNDAREMYDEADRAGRHLFACQNNRMGVIQALKTVVDSGRLGEVYFAEIECTSRRGVPAWGQFHLAAENGGGPLCDVGIHFVDALMYLLGNPRLKSASGKTWTKIANVDPASGKQPKGQDLGYVPRSGYDHRDFSVEDHAAGVLRFENDLLVSLKFAWALNLPPVDGYRLAGTNGGLVYNKRDRGDHPVTVLTTLDGYQVDVVPDIAVAKPGNGGVGHHQLIEHVADVLDGRTEPLIKRDEVLNVITAMEAFYLSGRLDREVRADEL